MNESDALKLLGLPSSATEEQIRQRFRELARPNHPDTGGDAKTMAQLVTARNISLAAARNRSLVPMAVVRDLIRVPAEELALREERRETARRIVGQIVRHHTSRYKKYKRSAAAFGVLSGATALISGKFLPVLGSVTDASPELVGGLTAVAAIAGVYYWVFSTAATNIQQSIEDVSDMLDDKSSLVGLIQRILGEHDEQLIRMHWTRDQLRQCVENSFGNVPSAISLVRDIFPTATASMRHLVRRIGAHDFTRLLLTKGMEKGVLTEHERIDEGRLVIEYAFTL